MKIKCKACELAEELKITREFIARNGLQYELLAYYKKVKERSVENARAGDLGGS